MSRELPLFGNIPKAPPKVIYILLDYDGCGDILFKYRRSGSPLPSDYERPNPKMQLEFLLEEIVKGYDIVILGVGSLRQSADIDFCNGRRNGNGFCFDNFKKLCDQKGWIFCDFLIADMENEVPLGLRGRAAFLDDKLDVKKNVVDFTLKPKILDMHISIVLKLYPHSEVTFAFLDDDRCEEIFPAIKQHLIKKTSFPDNWKVQLHLFNYSEDVANSGLYYDFSNKLLANAASDMKAAVAGQSGSSQDGMQAAKAAADTKDTKTDASPPLNFLNSLVIFKSQMKIKPTIEEEDDEFIVAATQNNCSLM